MDESKIMLLSQLVNMLNQATEELENAFNSQDKEKFDSAKAIVLEAQKKIDFMLKEVK